MTTFIEHARVEPRNKPAPSLEACTVNALNRSCRLGVTVGTRKGYVEGWAYGLVCGVCLAVAAVVVLKAAGYL